MEPDELAGWLRLALTPHVGNGAARRLLAAFGLPVQIFSQTQAALLDVVTPAQARALAAEPGQWAAQLESTLRWLATAGPEGGAGPAAADLADGTGPSRPPTPVPAEGVPVRRWILTLADPAYPAALLQIEDPPLMLYLMGQGVGAWPRAIALVGSRNPTPQGMANARGFARTFARTGLCVVSGMALGVDGAAHEGALEGAAPGQLATIAVVGTGLDRVYPRRHLALAHRIARQGLLVSEYPLGTAPLAANFPRRNRLIAALSQGTLVVEAALKSGSLITARLASEQGKDVFAIPGSIHSTQSRGCHWLLKQGAKLVETAEDLLEELQPAPAIESIAAQAVNTCAMAENTQEDQLLRALGFDPVGLDALIARTGTSAAHLQARLLELELEGRLARLPGGLFQRLVTA